MKKENTNAQMRKGVLEFCVLSHLHKQGSAYQADILKEAKLIVLEGNLYPLQSLLKNAGLLTCEWVESLQDPNKLLKQKKASL